MLPEKLPKFQESQLEKHGMYLNNATFSARGTAMHTRLIRLYPLILPNSQFSGAVVLCQFSDSENTDFFMNYFECLLETEDLLNAASQGILKPMSH